MPPANFDLGYFLGQLLHPSPLFLAGLGTTLMLAAAAQIFGFGIGLLLALARLSDHPLLRLAATAYIWVIRGIPLLVQIVFLYMGLAAAGILRFSDVSLGGILIPGNVQAAIVALSLHEAAYMAEIIRAGMLAVPKPEIEAAHALGASRNCTLRRIIVPRGLAIALPAIGNQFNSVLKNTTLVSVIGVSEALLVTQTIDAAVFRTFELYAVLAIYFLLLTSLWNIAVCWIEMRIRRREYPPTHSRLFHAHARFSSKATNDRQVIS